MLVAFIDFETRDPHIEYGVGSGWVYKHLYGSDDFKVLGCSIKVGEGETKFYTDYVEIKTILDTADLIVAHNAEYDLGCALTLGVDVFSKKVIDTRILAKLYSSVESNYSLEYLSDKYIKAKKLKNSLGDAVFDLDLYPYTKVELSSKKKLGDAFKRVRPDQGKLDKWAITHLEELMQLNQDVVATYCNQDVELCYQLFKFYMSKLDRKLALKYSMITHITMKYRINGIRVDLDRARRVANELDIMFFAVKEKIDKIAGCDLNLRSCKELPAALDRLGISYPRTTKGNPSITSGWLEEQEHDFCKMIVEARKLSNINNNFVKKLIDMQVYTCPPAHQNNLLYGRVHPTYNILAAGTGRFSCQAPNLQQIPARDKQLGPLCRSIFVSEEGEQFFALDYSAQEIRLQVHFAVEYGCEGGKEMALEYMKNPHFDSHQAVADMAGITRKQAKTLNLGLSYGMGLTKLADSLNLVEEEAKELRKKYNQASAYLPALDRFCKSAIIKNGYITTLGGRHVHLEAGIDDKTFEYKALNKLIQGSAADQLIQAITCAYIAKIKVIGCIHDELIMSGTREDALRLQDIMQKSSKLHVPVIAEFKDVEAYNWADAK